MGPDELAPTNFIDYTVEVYDTFTAFPEQGEPGRFYVDASDNHTYIWSNDLYVVIPNSFLHSVDSMPRYHTRLSVPDMANIEFAPLNSDTPTIAPTNMLLQDTDGDIHNMDTIAYVANGILTNIFDATTQTIRIGNLDLQNVDTFYDFLQMWPLYNHNGQVIGLFDTKEHRDQAKERLENMAAQRPTETTLQRVFKNVRHKTPVDDVS